MLPSPTEGRGHNNNLLNLCDAVRLAFSSTMARMLAMAVEI
jgi:hypothetical protein